MQARHYQRSSALHSKWGRASRDELEGVTTYKHSAPAGWRASHPSLPYIDTEAQPGTWRFDPVWEHMGTIELFLILFVAFFVAHSVGKTVATAIANYVRARL